MLPRLRILSLLLFVTTVAKAQPYTLLIKNAYLIDPGSHRHDTLDLAIKDNHIIKIAKHIDPHKAKHQFDARGMIICPGLIDIHTHVFFGAAPTPANAKSANSDRADVSAPDSAGGGASSADAGANADLEYAGGPEALHPDSFSFKSGVTTVVDAGSSGWRNFETFKTRVIDHSKTRILAFLNIVGAGMRGGHYEQNMDDMDGEATAAMALKYPNTIVGIKTAHFAGPEWKPVEQAVIAGTKANIPVMVDFGVDHPERPLYDLLTKKLRPGPTS